MTAEPSTGRADRTRVLLAAVDNALRNGSYMTGANYAFTELCDDLGVDRDELSPFDPRWIQKFDARLAAETETA